jgi:hypothetical protein
MRNADNAEVAADAGNSPPGSAISANGRAKTSARREAAIASALFAPGLSRVLDLPYKCSSVGHRFGQKDVFR